MSYGWPCDPDTEISQNFGANPNTVQPDGHTGMDFALSIGSPLYAIADGTVLVSDWADNVLGPNNVYGLAVTSWLGRSGGIIVIIDHGSVISIYAHMNDAPLNAGDTVKRGQLIGKSGDTGYTFGAHLHFEMMVKPLKWVGARWYGRVNPLNYISKEVIQPVASVTSTNQRSVGSGGVNYRKSPSPKGEFIQLFNPGDVLDFKGYVTNGEAPAGSNNTTYFVGAHTGGYCWSGAFDNSSTAGLANLTPAPAAPTLTSVQRVTGKAGAKYRPEPNTSKEETHLYVEGDVLNFVGWVRGQSVEGPDGKPNDVWLKGISGGYVWSGGLIPPNANGLTDLNPKAPAPAPVTPKPVPAPVPVTPTPAPKPVETFKGDVACVTEWIPAGEGNFQSGNFPAEPIGIVAHDYGTAGLDTYESSVAWFAKGNRENPSSAHFVVSGYDINNQHITQMCKLTDRAYHAGPQGNGKYIGVELDPRMHTKEDGGRTIALARILFRQLEEKYGYKLVLVEHNQIMATSCGDDVDLNDFANLGSVFGTPAPAPVNNVKNDIQQALDVLTALIKKL